MACSQDDIKLRSNLTVNAGIRWEFEQRVSANMPVEQLSILRS